MNFNEETLEHAVIELLQNEKIPHKSGLDIHKKMEEVLLLDDLKQYLLSRYDEQDITLKEIKDIIHELKILPASDLYDTNKAILKRIANGFTLKREDPTLKDLFIHLIDFEDDSHNIYKVVNQLEIKGYERRIPDAIIYINGIPLVVIEFKSAVKENCTIWNAYEQLTVRYRRDIPELFKYNAFCIISDGVNNKSGTVFTPYEFYYAWRKTSADENPMDGIDSLFTMISGMFQHDRLCDIIRHFIYFPDQSTKELKILCRYPQYYASKKLYASILANRRPKGSGKGGTYFGATGCGKSYTMLFLTRLLMKSPEFKSPTIVLITDRTDLDDQLSTTFTNAKEYIGDANILQIGSREDLRDELQGRQSGGVFLTTIQKFAEDTSLLTDRSNVICISDEAHRSQINLDQKITVTKKGVKKTYGFAKYLHDALPNATYVGFTGTPIDGTLHVFGEVVDAYTMSESVQDEITERIIYDGRAAKVNLNDKKLKEIEEYYKQCAKDGANFHQIEASKKAIAKLDTILGNPKRLQAVAKDFVEHYEKRVEEGATVKGKAMFVCSSRPIAYHLYLNILQLRPEWAEVKTCEEGATLTEKEQKEIKPMPRMRLIMTRGKDDPTDLYKTIGPKSNIKEYDRQFKNAKSNFKIALLVDMWLTGFDVPFLDTIYIDKPIQQHNLIQTISRVNRKFEGKEKGVVVDYIGIKKSMNKALKKYSKVADDDFEGVEKAVKLVKDQLDILKRMLSKFDSTAFFNGTPLERLKCLNKASEFVQLTKTLEHRFMENTKKLKSAYSLCCTHEDISQEEKDLAHFYFAIRAIVYKLTKGEAPDAAQMNRKVSEMIEEAIVSEGVEEIFKIGKDDLNIDIFSDEHLANINKITLPNTKIKLLEMLLKKAIGEFKKTNKIKAIDFSKRLRRLVEKYNERKEFEAMADNVLDDVAAQFAKLFDDLKIERDSFKDLGIDFEEKAFYDILKAIAKKYKFDYPEDKLIKLSKAVKVIVDDKAKYTDWAKRDDIKAELKVDLILTLAEHDYPPVPQDDVFKEIFEQAENFRRYSEEN